MNFPLLIYMLAGSILFCLAFPFFLIYTRVTGKHREGLIQRLGYYRRAVAEKGGRSVRVWVQAASVGEVAAAVPIIEALLRELPSAEIILSTTTAHGQAAARNIRGPVLTCVFAPVDFLVSVALALQTVKPDILVFVETEIWPSWLYLAHRQGIPAVMVNGRISVRSVKGYRRIRALIGPLLATVDAFSMIHTQDAARLKSLGVAAEKIKVNGNAKYDRLAGMVQPAARRAMADLFNLTGHEPVLVAGSLRRGEETLLLDVFKTVQQAFPNLVCVIAPRHMNRAAPIAARARQLKIEVQMRSGLQPPSGRRQAPLVILDTLGELQATYAVAAVSFCGGSLVPLGGQNVLEAAAWGTPVLFGPSMEDFQAEKELLLASGGGREVSSQRELARQILYYLSHPDAAALSGQAGQAAVFANTGASRKHAKVIWRSLTHS